MSPRTGWAKGNGLIEKRGNVSLTRFGAGGGGVGVLGMRRRNLGPVLGLGGTPWWRFHYQTLFHHPIPIWCCSKCAKRF